MMKRNKLLFFPIILLAGALITVSGCRKEPGYCGKNLPDSILKLADRSVKDLDLNPDQQKKYNEMKTEARANIVKYLEDRKKVSTLISGELAREKPDMNKIAGIMKDNPPIREEAYKLAIDSLMKFYVILDDKQKEKMIEKARQMQKKFGCESK
jgi:hypothetical protein